MNKKYFQRSPPIEGAFGSYSSRKLKKYEAIEVGVWKRLCWRESFQRIQQQQEAIEVGGYRSMCLEKAVLERELSQDTPAAGG